MLLQASVSSEGMAPVLAVQGSTTKVAFEAYTSSGSWRRDASSRAQGV